MSYSTDVRPEGPNDVDNADERWLSRHELAERYGLPVKTLAQWASKGADPRYARMGRHVRYRLSDVIDW
jgi:predicted DNA-binding transcriptional regulator AlpA